MGRFAILALLLCAHGVRAQPVPDESDDDPFAGVEPPQPPEEARHPAPYWIAGRLDGVTAKLVVRYHLQTVGPSGFNHFEVDLPDNGVVTGAVVHVEGRAHRLAFEAVEQGTADFETVLGKPAGPRRRWEVEVSSDFSSATKIDVAAPRAAMVTIDLEVDAPTCFSHGVRYASVDPAWHASIDRTLHAVTAAPTGCVARPNDEGGTGMPKAWIAFASDDGRWRPAGEQRVIVRAERVDVEHGHFARVEVNLANELSEVPADLHTVFVIDASRSVTQTERETQAAVVQSYARHAPGTQIQIIAFARKAHALLPGWTRAGGARLGGLAAIAPANGSNVDTGLIEAAAWLARTEGTRRIVLFGDERLGKRVTALAANALRGVVPERTVVHVVALDAGPPPTRPHEDTLADSIVRADDITFAQLARDTEGLAARATLVDDRVDATKLVRPIALEQVSVHAAGWADIQVEANEPACTGDLVQGSACAWFGADDQRNGKPALAPTIVLEGLLWNHRVHRTITPDAGQRERLARMLTGFMANLGDAQHDLQVVARAVNEAWVLYGEWGDGDGYGDASFANLYGSGCGCDDGGMQGGFGFGSVPTVHMFGGPTLAQQLERATAACHVDARVEIAIELTDQEIVDVAVTAPRAALRDCVTEAVWATMLSINDPQLHAFETIALGS
ncbi:MAG TPA: VWA domain-containing protein [Kofleriaceae bacterium]|nr:VWA domain-containing protein [Kofleriaceae bacterium]